MTYQITAVDDMGADVLRVTATSVDAEGEPRTVTADGWVSATTNYYPPHAYDPATGNRRPQWEDPDGSGNLTSDPRDMTAVEVEAYCRALIDAAYPDL